MHKEVVDNGVDALDIGRDPPLDFLQELNVVLSDAARVHFGQDRARRGLQRAEDKATFRSVRVVEWNFGSSGRRTVNLD